MQHSHNTLTQKACEEPSYTLQLFVEAWQVCDQSGEMACRCGARP